MQLSVFKNGKAAIVAVFILMTISHSNAQEKPAVEKSQFKINVLLPGFVYEHGLGDKNTLYSELSSGYGYTSNSFGKTWTFYPYINEQFRHYYNLEKRAAKGKVTSHNSGGFVAMSAFYNFRSISTNDNFLPKNSSITVAPVWGFQRTYKGNFNLDLNMGVGYNFEKNDSGLVPVLNFTLGWVIGK
ncbi:hypothetical protein E0I61_14720 [Flavobacterium ranwuense]|uniref:DUF3575 domain-containing protein n=1 Tax=Flavobacterium ranwuense TaxID=2541725 RepID=A0ABY2DP65_9FLAO|nr:hypothetical protein [Flavobacterium ranwuense]TDE27564.1 hypothetical protein E0I61_14720 [Flavobacterium ranwuense]